jgi:hypothetical protein
MEAGVTLNLHNSPFAKGVDEAKKKAQDFGHTLDSVTESLKKVFADSPKLAEKGSTAINKLTKGFVNLKSVSAAAGSGSGGMGFLLGGLIGGAVGAGISKIPEIIGRISTEGQAAKQRMHELGTEGLKLSKSVRWEVPAEGIHTLMSRSKDLHKNHRGVNDELRKYDSSKHPVTGTFRRTYAGLSGAYEGLKTGQPLVGLGVAAWQAFRPEEMVSGQKQSADKTKEIAKNRADIVQSMKDSLSVTKEAITGDKFEAQILQERFDTEVQIAALRDKFKNIEVAPLREASALRIQQLEDQKALAKIDIAAEYHKAQATRPGIGLTDREVTGAQLFRDRRDIQRQLLKASNPMERAKLSVQFDQTRNSIEELEYRQYIAEDRATGSQRTGGTYGGTTQAQGERLQAQRRKGVQDMIRRDPALKKRLDDAAGLPYAEYAPGQTQLLPSEVKTEKPAGIVGVTSPSRRGMLEGAGGGRTIADLYNLIEQKWQ